MFARGLKASVVVDYEAINVTDFVKTILEDKTKEMEWICSSLNSYAL